MPTYRLLSAIACGALGAAVACGDFGSSPDTTPGTLDGGGGGGDATSTGDGGSAPPPDNAILDATTRPPPSEVQPDGLYLTCPPTSTHGKFTNLEHKTIVSRAPGFDYPFGIVTDQKYVFWVSQPQPAGATDPQKVAGYNGHAKGRIHRALKNGSAIDPTTTILADGEKEETVAIALDGEWVYWAAVKEVGAKVAIRRVKRECSIPCSSPQTVGEIPATTPIVQMHRAKPGLIFLLAGDGKVFAFETENATGTQVSAGPGDFPAMTTTDEHAFVSSLQKPKVLKVGLESVMEHGTFLTGGPQAIGGRPLATDCTRLFAYRKDDQKIWVADATKPSSFEPFSDVKQLGAYDVVADNDYVYMASLDGYGISVIDVATRQLVRQYGGSYISLTADDTGLYTGDHDHEAPGAIYRYGD